MTISESKKDLAVAERAAEALNAGEGVGEFDLKQTLNSLREVKS